MTISNKFWIRNKLKLLSLVTPKYAALIATRLFAQSRNAANPYRKAFTPKGAKVITLTESTTRVKNIYLWGETGDIVLLIHGWGSHCASMFGFVEILLKQGYRVATFDAPAHGSSEGVHTTMSEYATITKIIIKKLGPVTKIIAHSLGGIAAMAAATKNPIIEQMILISTPTSLLDVLDIWSSSVMKLGKRMRKLIVAQLLIDNGVPVSHWNIALHGKDWLVPVHVLHDKNDVVINVNHAKKISAALPKSNTWFTQGLGHTKILFSKNVHQQIAILFQQYKIIGSKTISDNHNNF